MLKHFLHTHALVPNNIRISTKEIIQKKRSIPHRVKLYLALADQISEVTEKSKIETKEGGEKDS